MNKIFYASVFLITVLISCKPSDKASFDDQAEETTSEVIIYNNPPAEGFDIAGSSTHAIVMADQIMNAMGGREKWDKTNVFYWNFFGKRQLLWDKSQNKVRVDAPEDSLTVVLNMNDMSGQAWKAGKSLTDQSALSEKLDWAKNVWINDSYWLFMPFKLKDSGVTLTYVGEDSTLAGTRADVLRLTFKNVGVTPQNAYHVWVDYDSRLITQWAYFQDASQTEPSFVLPWTDYQSYDGLMLAGNRGERSITDIKVLQAVPAGAFDSAKPIAF